MSDLVFDAPPPQIDHVPYEKYGLIAFDVAVLGQPSQEDVDVILDKFEISRDTFAALLERPAFRRSVAEAKLFISKHADSNSFKVKSRYYAERLITRVFHAVDQDTAAVADQMKAMEALVRYADLDPSGRREGSKGGGASASVVLNIASGIRGISQVDNKTMTLEVDDEQE